MHLCDILLLLSFCFLVSGKSVLTFLVDQRNGKCEPICLISNLSRSIPCCSIEYVAREFGSNTSNIWILLSGQNLVNQLITFRNISQLTIHGNSDQKPSLLCKRQLKHAYGLQFLSVDSLLISGVEIIGCGAEHHFTTKIIFRVAIAIINSSNVSLIDIKIFQSKGTSLFIKDTSGNVTLKEIIINKNNTRNILLVDGGKSFAGGVFIYISSSLVTSFYKITFCVFEYTRTLGFKTFDVRNVMDTIDWLGFGLGGGLSIIFNGYSTHNTVLIEKCIFQYNFAPWGGGMSVRFQQESSYNSVFISNSNFKHCKAILAGGGLDVGSAKRSLHLNNNTIGVINTTFWNNSADYGGGTHIFALSSNLVTKKGNFINFLSCKWIENMALYSPAVDVSPDRFDELNNGALPIPVFQDCIFIRNNIQFKKLNVSRFTTSGVFVITRFRVSFAGTVRFESNTYTALLLNSGQVVIEENSHITFINNAGFRGGAVALHGFSYLTVNNNSLVEFFNNSATEFGGAIFYYPIEQRELIKGRVCFIRYAGYQHSKATKRNITFSFVGNSASISGSSIYSTTLFSCYYSYRGRRNKQAITEFFNDIGDFSFDGIDSVNSQALSVGTPGHHFQGKKEEKFLVTLPGMKLNLPLKVVDDLLQDVTYKTTFLARVIETNTSVFLSSPYTLNKSVILYGPPHESTNLVVSTQHTYKSIEYTLNVTLLPCPPGYYYEDSTCHCSSTNSLKAYIGIVRCNENYSAVIKQGYWTGYVQNDTMLYTAPCPFHYCITNTHTSSDHVLPNTSEALTQSICGQTRHGVLCGKCKEGYSVYYHSQILTCGRNANCQFGILLFVVSELLPVFIFFTAIVIFDISFSSGSRNGFIFFSQMVTILPLDFILISQSSVTECLYIGYTI